MSRTDDRTEYRTEYGLSVPAELLPRHSRIEPGAAPGIRLREFAGADELAAYVNVTRETFDLLADHAGIRPVEVDGQQVYERAAVKEFLRMYESWGGRRF